MQSGLSTYKTVTPTPYNPTQQAGHCSIECHHRFTRNRPSGCGELRDRRLSQIPSYG